MDKFEFGNYDSSQDVVFDSNKGYVEVSGETEARKQLSSPLNQLKDHINNTSSIDITRDEVIQFGITNENYVRFRRTTNGAWTDIAAVNGRPGPAGPGVITGGTTGQALTKKSDYDYDTQWADMICWGDDTSATSSQTTTLFEDNAKTKVLYPKTKVNAVSDENGDGLQVLLNAKQDELVSGTNIKTINGESLLGAGNISGIPEFSIKGTATLSVSGGSIESQNVKYALTSDRTIGMIWGWALVKGQGSTSPYTKTKMTLGITVAQQSAVKQFVGNVIPGTINMTVQQIVDNFYTEVDTNGEVSLYYTLTTNTTLLMFLPIIMRFSDF